MIKEDKAGVAAALFPAGCTQLFNNLEEEGVSVSSHAMESVQRAMRMLWREEEEGFFTLLWRYGCWLVSTVDCPHSGYKKHRGGAARVTQVLIRIKIKIQHS